jgi:hypothetical protein
MKELVVTVIGGILVMALGSWFGIGSSRVTTVEGVRIRKSGKWMIIISVIMIIGGLSWAGSGNTLAGYTLVGYGFLLFIVGRVVAWFQKI